MNLPPSFSAAGFLDASTLRKPRIMIGSDGPADSGKTEFALSAPGPTLGICLDRGIDSVLNNPEPPTTRQDNFAFKVIKIPSATQSNSKDFYAEYWKEFYDSYRAALENAQARTVLVDGDSDSYELQRLAAFGRLSKVPPLEYTAVNASRKVYYNRAWDSGKIVIFTNKIKKEYETTIDPKTGDPKISESGNEVREWNGNYERQGFQDQDYLFHVQIRHFYSPPTINKKNNKTIPGQFGLCILKCKPNMALIGEELRGPDCNFAGLVQLVYPHIPLKAWEL